MAGEEQEALRDLEQRLGEASETAQRLMAEAAAAAQGQQAGPSDHDDHGATRPPPSGWQPPKEGRPNRAPGAELDALLGAIRSLRELVPPEVVQRLAEAVKDLLLALRALIDWYIERLNRRPTDPAPVEDIPIE
jgi:hypothetical protein